MVSTQHVYSSSLNNIMLYVDSDPGKEVEVNKNVQELKFSIFLNLCHFFLVSSISLVSLIFIPS